MRQLFHYLAKIAFPISTMKSLGHLLFLFLAPAAFAVTPVITQQPVSQTIFIGDPATFRVTATGSAPLAYQWFRNGVALTSATTSTCSISAVSSNDDSAAFSVTVSNSEGAVTSEVATLTVDYGVPGEPTVVPLFSYSSSWKYDQTENLDGINWTASNYDDSAWSSGPGLLAAENNSAIVPLIGTTLIAPQSPPAGLDPSHAYYFRTTLKLTNDYSYFTARYRCDDGAVIYINGSEVERIRMPLTGDIYNMTFTEGGSFPPGGSSDATVDEEIQRTPQAWRLAKGTNVLAVSVHQANSGSSDIVWGLSLDGVTYSRMRDTNAPVLSEMLPAPGSTVPALTQIEVHFSEGVKGVRAGDLLINNSPATNLSTYGPTVYVFDFPPPPTGQVQVAWSTAQAITDLSANSNRFVGGSYGLTVDPSAIANTVWITEFMTGNTSTIRDEDGHYSDWIELFNSSDQPVSLSRWYLTDNPGNLRKWQFPVGASIMPRSYLLVWASSLNRTNPAAPLHTNFKLDKADGNFLALVYSDGATVLSSFSPYPQQYDDVSYGRDRLDPSLVGYFTTPTPKASNSTIGAGFGPEVQFSMVSGTFRQPFTLSLSTADPNMVIRYLLVTNAVSARVTNVPSANSPLYTGPITINNTVQVRARAFPQTANLWPGPPRNETFFRLADDVAGFSSDLPVVVFDNMGAGTDVPASDEQFIAMQVFDTRNGRSSLLNPPDLAAQGYFHRRGQATFWNAKANLRVETQDAYGDDQAVEFLGMPAESDWVFYGINGFDKVLMHNPLSHDLYQGMGHYSSNTRYVEVYIKLGTDATAPITRADYYGLYVIEEKIKVGKNRVDIDKLRPENTNAPSVTGGYLLSIDKSNPGAPAYLANASIWYLDPDYYEITSPDRAAQKQYIDNYFNSFYSALTGPNWTDPLRGYAAYIDMDSWIDYHLNNTFVFNADMLRISAYFYKPRDGKIVQGPLWDFDRAFADSNDGRGFNPRRWRSADGDGGTDPFNPCNTFNNPWYSIMFTDPDFWQKWIDRYQELRKSSYSLTNLYARIDYFGNQVRGATTREYARWGDTQPRSGTYSADGLTYTFPSPGTWQGELNFVKYWFSNRVDFMDSNFLIPPVFSSNGGAITSGFALKITAPTKVPNSTIYYTLDGTDPRLPGGSISPTALSSLNNATVTFNSNARVFARNYNANHQNLTGENNPPISSSWSGPTVGTFVISTPTLAVTEVMYNPARPASGTNSNEIYEFIELKNTGVSPVNLLGVHFTKGLDFTFRSTNAITTLPPGAYLVLVRDVAAFASRYPGVTNIAGVFSSALDNSGERIALKGALGEPIEDFTYNNSWYPVTDGSGFSLVPRVETGAASSEAAGWRASSLPGGSPGRPDPLPAEIAPILITEALTHTDPPQVDSVEFFNPTANPVSIAGWFLTDDKDFPTKFRIPDSTSIAAGGYAVINETEFNAGANPFALSSLGDAIYLYSGNGTNLTGYRHGFQFGPQINGVTFGLHVTSDGKEHFVTEKGNTIGLPNLGAKVGPVVISEIMYAPRPFGENPDTVDEFIELRNISDFTVPLFDPLHTTNSWKLQGAVQFTFPSGASMLPWSYLLLVNFDPMQDPASLNWFRGYYGIGSTVPIMGPYQGNLANEGEHLGIYMPDKPEIAPSPNAGFVPYVLAEDVHYSDTPPWPVGTRGTGQSLQRLASATFADDPANWIAAIPTLGTVPNAAFTVDSDQDGLPDELEFVAGTDATDPTDYLKLESNGPVNGNVSLQFISRLGRTYAIERKSTLSSTEGWTVWKDNLLGVGGLMVVSDIPAGETAYYRLRVKMTN
jgi:hypothetical protein